MAGKRGAEQSALAEQRPASKRPKAEQVQLQHWLFPAQPSDALPSTNAIDTESDEVVVLQARDPLQVPAILYLDSLLPVPKPLYQRLTQYLQEAWAARFPPPHPRSRMRWTKPAYIGGLVGPAPSRHAQTGGNGFALLGSSGSSRAALAHHVDDDPLYEMKVPEQRNGCDCGLFLLEYTEQFCLHGPRLLRQWFATQESKRVAAAASASSGKAAPTRGGSANTRFEDVLFKGWKITGMHQKRNKLMEILKREERAVVEECEKKLREEASARNAKAWKEQFVQQTKDYSSLLRSLSNGQSAAGAAAAAVGAPTPAGPVTSIAGLAPPLSSSPLPPPAAAPASVPSAAAVVAASSTSTLLPTSPLAPQEPEARRELQPQVSASAAVGMLTPSPPQPPLQQHPSTAAPAFAPVPRMRSPPLLEPDSPGGSSAAMELDPISEPMVLSLSPPA